MPRSPFDLLPPRDRKKHAAMIKRDMSVPLSALQRFSDSIREGRPPIWPDQSGLVSFKEQLRAFRSISKRKYDTPPISLMREMDGLWPKLKIVATLDLCVDRLRDYLGPSLISRANKIRFERGEICLTDDLHSLLQGKTLASSADFTIMHDLLPHSFQGLAILASARFVRPAAGAPAGTLGKLTTAAARAAQQYLIVEERLFQTKIRAAHGLRKFIHGLRHPPFTKLLFGLSDTQIEQWETAEERAGGRIRQARYRQKRAERA